MSVPIFRQALGKAWADLPPVLRAFHGEGAARWTGEAAVTRGPNAVAGRLAGLFGFPPESDAVPVRILVERHAEHEVWRRDFGGHVLATRLTQAGPGRVTEAVGPAAFDLSLSIADTGLEVGVAAGRFLGIPLPRAILPLSASREWAEDGRLRFDIRVALPLLGPMIRYRGQLSPEEDR